jgi:hypothetical protein
MPDPPAPDSDVSTDVEPPPLFSSWGRFYAAILVWEAIAILTIAAISAWPYRR